MRISLSIALAITISVVATATSRAAIVFSNFGQNMFFPDNGRILQGELVGNIANVDQAAAFNTGPSPVFVTDVKLGIYVDSPTNSPFDGRGPLDIIIASDAAGLPGAALHTTSLSPNTFLTQIADASIGGSVLLAANTQYWIIADAKGKFDGAWEDNPINDHGPTAGRSNNGPWSAHSLNDPRMVFQVEGRFVPEPTTLALVASGLIVTSCQRRRRKSPA